MAEIAKAQPDPFNFKIDELILCHLSDPQVSVKSIADAFDMLKTSFYRKRVDVSPNEQLNAYIIRTRLEESA